ncbi:MAG: DUF4304 domain-containing protein, partial [Variovorax sp.]
MNSALPSTAICRIGVWAGVVKTGAGRHNNDGLETAATTCPPMWQSMVTCVDEYCRKRELATASRKSARVDASGNSNDWSSGPIWSSWEQQASRCTSIFIEGSGYGVAWGKGRDEDTRGLSDHACVMACRCGVNARGSAARSSGLFLATMSPANLITAVVRTHLKPLLAARGFTSSGSTFKRRVGEAVQVVNIERSKRNGALAARFYINGSVYLPALDAVIGEP